MGIGISVFLLAVGAILAFAVDVVVSGVDLDAVGVILMIVGVIGLIIAFTTSRGFFGRPAYRREERIEHEDSDGRRVVRRSTLD